VCAACVMDMVYGYVYGVWYVFVVYVSGRCGVFARGCPLAHMLCAFGVHTERIVYVDECSRMVM
jgi:hypothetical protein